MAYVVARPHGRFEIRESVYVADAPSRGPKSRSLASFRQLTDAVLDKAEARATRSFDREAVIASAVARGAATPETSRRRYDAFVESSRRMAGVIERSRRPANFDAGKSLIELIGLAEEVARHQPMRTPEALGYPVLARVRRRGRRSARR